MKSGYQLLADPVYPPTRLPLPYLVNSVAISDDASRVIAGTFYYAYYGTIEPKTDGCFGTYAIERTTGKRLWADEYVGSQGVFAVAISGDGQVAAAGGLLDSQKGLLRAYDAANGALLLDYQGISSPVPGNARNQRVSCVSLSADGKVLGAVADKVYVFVRSGLKFPDQPTAVITFPDAFNVNSLPTAVAIHSSGNWLAACDKKGNVCLATIANGQVQEPYYRWCAPQVPFNRTQPGGPTGSVILLSVAAARNAEYFVTGGNDYVYYFGRAEMMKTQAPMTSSDTWDNTPPPTPANGNPPKTAPQNVRWVAISGDGSLVTTVVNRYKNGGRNGSLLALRFEKGGLALAWEQLLARNPNSTSVATDGTYVAACDGYPFGKPGAFYGFGADGSPRWVYDTDNMNWPIVISANGQGIAGGGDDGMVYSFPRI